MSGIPQYGGGPQHGGIPQYIGQPRGMPMQPMQPHQRIIQSQIPNNPMKSLWGAAASGGWSRSASPPMAGGRWSCKSCTFINGPDVARCDICDAANPAQNTSYRGCYTANANIANQYSGMGAALHDVSTLLRGGTVKVDARSEEEKKRKDSLATAMEAGAGKTEAAVYCGCIDETTFNTVHSIIMAFMIVFRLTVSTLFAIMVPQLCVAEPESSIVSRRVNHECTIEENLYEWNILTGFNQFVVLFNFGTLGVAFAVTYFAVKRERALIVFFDADPSVSPENLVIPHEAVEEKKSVDGQPGRRAKGEGWKLIDSYQPIKEELNAYNENLYVVSLIASVMNLVNIIVSFILIMQYFNDYKTLSTFFINAGVIAAVIFGQFTVAAESYHKDIAISSFTTAFVAFNTIDPLMRFDSKYCSDSDILEMGKWMEQKQQVRAFDASEMV